MNNANIREKLRKLTIDEATSLYWKCHQKTYGEISKQVFDTQLRTVQSHITNSYNKLDINTAPGVAASVEDLTPYCDEIKSWVGEIPWPSMIPHWPPVTTTPRNTIRLVIALIAIAALMVFLLARISDEIGDLARRIWDRQPETVVTQVVIVITATSEPTTVPTTQTPSETPQPTATTASTEVVVIVPTATGVVEATATPEPTSVPLYTVGDEARDDFVEIELIRFNYYPTIAGWMPAINFRFEVENLTVDSILVNLDADDFILTDNNGKEYECILSVQHDMRGLQNDITRNVTNRDLFVLFVHCGKSVTFGPDVEEVILHMPKIYSLEPTDWVILVVP